MTAVRNACVARGQAAAASQAPVYTVPAGHVLLLKSIASTPEAAVDWSIEVFLSVPAGPYVQLVGETLTAGAFLNWSGWIALNELDMITVRPSGVACWYWVSGALLPYQVLTPP